MLFRICCKNGRSVLDMTSSQRIALNTVASYGRSLFALVFGLFGSRWVLQSLGATDFGLYGVVGSIIIFITFINTVLSTSVARFYAYSIGQGQRMPTDEALKELQKWFNTAVSIHFVLPMFLILIGYPVGIYAIHHWLVMPPDRIQACIWVFRISLITAFVNMLSVPYVAMYAAHQLITELAFWGIVSSVCSCIGAFCLFYVQSDRLIIYALYMMGVGAGIPIIQVFRAMIKFPACRFNYHYLCDIKRLQNFFGFAGAKIFGGTCVILRNQGGILLINRYFTPSVNASFSIAAQVSGQTNALSQALIGALLPALVSKEGGGDRAGMLKLASSACRIATLLVLLFTVPLLFEMDTVLKVWLVNPPIYTREFCLGMLVMLLFDKVSVGYMLAANAYGKHIIVYEIVLGTILLLAFPITWVLFKFGSGPVALVYSLCGTMLLNSFARIWFCIWQLRMSFWSWIHLVVIPVICVFCLSSSGCYLVVSCISPTVYRIFVTGFVSFSLTCLSGWFMLLTKQERSVSKQILGIACQKLIYLTKIRD